MTKEKTYSKLEKLLSDRIDWLKDELHKHHQKRDYEMCVYIKHRRRELVEIYCRIQQAHEFKKGIEETIPWKEDLAEAYSTYD